MNVKLDELPARPLRVRSAVGRRTDSPGLQRFEELASQKIRLALAKDGITLKDLSRRLSQCGIEMDNKNLSQKIKAGTFSAALLLAIMQSLESGTGTNES